MTKDNKHTPEFYKNDPRTIHIKSRDASKLGTLVRQDYFLIALECLGTVRESVAFTKIARQQHFKWLDTDERYQVKYARAQEAFSDVLESELYRRALVGVEEDVYHQGVVVGQKRKYSDQLLLTALKANLSDKYSEKTKTTIESTSTAFNINVDVTKKGLEDKAQARTADLIAQYQSVRPPVIALDEGVEVMDK